MCYLQPTTIHLTGEGTTSINIAPYGHDLDNEVQGFKTEIIEGQWRPFGPAEGPEGRFFLATFE